MVMSDAGDTKVLKALVGEVALNGGSVLAGGLRCSVGEGYGG